MKPTELKKEYIRLRAEGRSYSYIAKQLHISKSTCSTWEQELSAEINELKRAELKELYESYGMTKQARIKNLGKTLNKINKALDGADFSGVDPLKLLDFKIKYMEALKGEFIGLTPSIDPKDIKPDDIVTAFADLLNRTQSGDITDGQAQKESTILSNLLKAYDTAQIKPQLDRLEAIVGRRA